MMRNGFRQLDDLVLQLKGLVLVRKVREGRGADVDELTMYDEEIARVRTRLADLVRIDGLVTADGSVVRRGLARG
jgi:hypothetical protein